MIASRLASAETRADYESIALDYYSSDHATTRNFDDATADYFRTRTEDYQELLSQTTLDIGCGRGQYGEYFPNVNLGLHYEMDTSPSMLSMPRQHRVDGTIRGSALRIPLPDDSVDMTTAFLFDPFNVLPFALEARRVTRAGGVFVGTLPSYDFASYFRVRNDLPVDRTRFVDQHGHAHVLESHISSDSELIARFKNARFTQVQAIPIMLQGKRVPSKHVLSAAAFYDIPVASLSIITMLVCR